MPKKSKKEVPTCDYCGQALPPLLPIEMLASKLRDAVYKAQPNGHTACEPWQKLSRKEQTVWLAAAQVAKKELIDAQNPAE